MNIEEIKEILKDVSFAPSNLDMGWDWDVKPSQIYDDNNVTLEKGFVIRTTFMRPDINSGEIEKGYGRWMYIPQNISKDGVVKTAWVCAELIVKHELMEAFLYDRKKIFDPHKSLEDLQYNTSVVEEIKAKDIDGYTKLDSGYYLSEKDGKIYENIDGDMIMKSEPKSEDVRIPTEDKTPSSEEIFHKQNVGNHMQEIKLFLDTTFKKVNLKNERVKRYQAGDKIIDLHLTKNGLTLSTMGGEVIHSLNETNFTLSSLNEMIEKNELKGAQSSNDPGDINELIIEFGYTEVDRKEVESDADLNIWKFINPKNSSRYIIHSETNKFVSMVNKNNDILGTVEDDGYNYDNVKNLLSGTK